MDEGWSNKRNREKHLNMGIINLKESLTKLIDFWRRQEITISTKPKEEINDILLSKNIILPNDFIDYYSSVNGMDLDHESSDSEGFYFYPVNSLIKIEEIAEPADLESASANIIIFADYLHESWWYGIDINSDGTYHIGIVLGRSEFNHITNALSEFIELYMEDSSRLYNV